MTLNLRQRSQRSGRNIFLQPTHPPRPRLLRNTGQPSVPTQNLGRHPVLPCELNVTEQTERMAGIHCKIYNVINSSSQDHPKLLHAIKTTRAPSCFLETTISRSCTSLSLAGGAQKALLILYFFARYNAYFLLGLRLKYARLHENHMLRICWDSKLQRMHIQMFGGSQFIMRLLYWGLG